MSLKLVNAILAYFTTLCDPLRTRLAEMHCGVFSNDIHVFCKQWWHIMPTNGDNLNRILCYLLGTISLPAWRHCSANAEIINSLIFKWIHCCGFRFRSSPSLVTSLYVLRSPLQFDGGSAECAFTLLQNGTRVLGRWRDCRCHRDHLGAIQTNIRLCGREQNTQQR